MRFFNGELYFINSPARRVEGDGESIGTFLVYEDTNAGMLDRCYFIRPDNVITKGWIDTYNKFMRMKGQ
jgi:hypothetical protein